MILPQAIYAIGCILFALVNYKWIKEDRPISHKLNAACHLLIWVAALFYQWRLIFVLPFIGKLFFDVSLNLFRKLPLGYSSEWGDYSKLDQLEKTIFMGSGLAAKIAYFIIIVVINLIFIYGN